MKRIAIFNLLLASALLASVASAAVAAPSTKASQFIPIKNEPAPQLHLDAPLAEPLSGGVAVIPYRVENFRILPIFGAAALDVSPRAGHLHVTVDDLPWQWADAGNTESVVVAELPAGRHSVLIELATPDHQIIGGQRIHFDVPAARGHSTSYGTGR